MKERALSVTSNLDACRRYDLPYRARRALLSRGEKAFYDVLRVAVDGRFAISIKPRLADVVLCPRTQWRSPAGSRVKPRHVDFLLYDHRTTSPILALELDDVSHDTAAGRDRDTFVDHALFSAGVVLMRVRAAARYDALELAEALEVFLGHSARVRAARRRAAYQAAGNGGASLRARRKRRRHRWGSRS